MISTKLCQLISKIGMAFKDISVAGHYLFVLTLNGPRELFLVLSFYF